MSEVDYNEVASTLIQDKAFITGITGAFTKVMAEAQKQAAMKATVADPPPYNQIHGFGSMFGGVAVGIDREVVSAMMHWVGLGEHLPTNPVRTVEIGG